MTMLLLAITTFALPLLVPRGPGNTAPVDAFAVLFLIAVLVTATLARRRFALPAAAPLLLIAAVSALGVVFSVAPGSGLLNLLIEFYLAVLFWAVCNQLRNRPDRMLTVTSIWVGAAVFWAFLLIGAQWHLLPGSLSHLLFQYDSSGRAAAAARNPNLAASYLVTSMFVLAASPWPRSKLVRIPIYAWLLIAVVVSGSNGAFLGAAVGGAVLLGAHVVRRWSQLGRVMVAATLMIAAGFAIFTVAVAKPTVNQTTVANIAQSQQNGALHDNVGRLDNSVGTRVSLWSSALRGGFSQSALGVGVGEAQTIQVDNVPIGKSLHNDVLAFLLERGIVGLAALLLLIGVVVRWSARLARAGPVSLGGRTWRFQGLAAGIAANCVISLTHESFHFRHVWLLAALVWVAVDLVKSPAAEPVHQTMPSLAVPMRAIHVPA
jgi:O-antigen ligase